MTVANQVNPPPWSVVSQQEQTQPGPNGQLTDGMVVTFLTESGVTGTVFVPLTQYSAATVRQLINDKVSIIESVNSLTHEG